MLLAIDIGNTNVTLGVFEGGSLGPRLRLATGAGNTADEYGVVMLDAFRRMGVAATDVRAVALASVVPALTPLLVEACEGYLRHAPLVVDGTMRTGLRSLYDDPRQLGVDRIVDAAAAYKIYGAPACVIDFGTATTFDAISGDGDFLGGAIAPGVAVAAASLFGRAAKLPKVDLDAPPSAIGRNLRHSLQSGLLYGYVGLVEGMVARFRAELGRGAKVVATGGLAEVVARETKSIDILAPWLTLEGVRIIHELNVPSVAR
ncbi:MAG: type III pantothenate kinase [Acidobacteriota bacterium]|nr:type III pantothenate kinase [Acidobacteriota bacterium]